MALANKVIGMVAGPLATGKHALQGKVLLPALSCMVPTVILDDARRQLIWLEQADAAWKAVLGGGSTPVDHQCQPDYISKNKAAAIKSFANLTNIVNMLN